MTIGERIKHRREELNMSQEELAFKLGYKSRSSVNKIETGLNNLTQSKIKAIADALITTPSYIMGWANSKNSNAILKPKNEIKLIPLVGTAACGNPIYADENIEKYIYVDKNANVDFAVVARGDSMNNAKIDDGDILYVRQQPIVDDGDIALVLIDDEVTIKRFYNYPDKVTLSPDSRNPKHKPLEFYKNTHQIYIQGKIIFIQTNVY